MLSTRTTPSPSGVHVVYSWIQYTLLHITAVFSPYSGIPGFGAGSLNLFLVIAVKVCFHFSCALIIVENPT